MLPREFDSRFGRPLIHVVDDTVTESVVASLHRDRYLLAFTTNGIAIRVRPTSDVVGFNGGFSTSTTSPLILTHALHGSLVNLEWQVELPFPLGGQLMVIEGFMLPDKFYPEGGLYGREFPQTLRIRGRSDINPGSRAEPATPFSAHQQTRR